ncbi:hypothetical protein CPB83DRAFT_843281 [Crepidotus variabilis]|uniref:Uncharacterized protein n=1 Tax=Crepidotus variabilis TaxID=179855 RepID=A0A9P6ERX0_9AGAR|nr:hypothetical protein CPB83DRAFT_843281 [Crepidotus variabilis]
MLAIMVLSSLAALLFVYVFMPALWASIMALDDSLDRHEAGIALVASRNPFRETGPPANMAKLILLRHKIQTNNRRRSRSNSQSRQGARTVNLTPSSPTNRSKATWIRLGRPFAGKQTH